MSASRSHADLEKSADRAALIRMLSYAEVEARAMGEEDAARHIACAARLMAPPPVLDWGLAHLEPRGAA